MIRKMRQMALSVVGKISAFILCEGCEASTCSRAWFLVGRKWLTKIIEWIKSQGLKLSSFVLRCLKWWMYFVGNCVIAVTATSFGFALGIGLIVLLYDDGLEKVMDLYNYFKNPPRS